MIRTHSDDPDVAAAAQRASGIVQELLSKLPAARTFDYGGHNLTLGEYEVCTRCTTPIAEAQQASQALLQAAENEADSLVKEHLQEAAHLCMLEAKAAELRAEFHNGHGSEGIVDGILAFMYDRNVHDNYDHHHGDVQ